MIYFLAVWAFVLISSYLTGVLILKGLINSEIQRSDERFVVSIWLGLLFFAILLLTLSLGVSLSPMIAMGVMGICGGVSLFFQVTRQEMKQMREIFSPTLILATLVLGISVLLLTTRQVTWSESAAYHYSTTRWLSEFGITQGIVLILNNLGIVSSWFALIAPWNGAAVNFQAGAVINGFILFLMGLHFLLCLSLWVKGEAKLSDRFIMGFYLLFGVYAGLSKQMQLIIVSLSPDFPIIALTGVISWVILVISPDFTPKSSSNSRQLPSAIIPFLLGVGAFSIKLSALPLLLISGIFYEFKSRFKVKYLIIGGILATIGIIPVLIAGINLSGCPLYPSPYFCLDVPWGLDRQATQQFFDETQNLEKWFGSPPSDQFPQLWLFWKWFNGSTRNKMMTFLGLISILCLLFGIKIRQKPFISGKLWLSLLSIGGMMFFIWKGPLIRFALGYLLILPALSLAIHSETEALKRFIFIKIAQWGKFIDKILLFFLAILCLLSLSYPTFQSRLIFPPAPPTVASVKKQVNDVTYFFPQEEEGGCWASPLPCGRYPDKFPYVWLKNPSSGIKGGFVRQKAQ